MTDLELQQIKQLIDEAIGKKIDRTVFEKHIQILDARNIQLGRTNGTMIGTATDQKLGFFGKAPVVQQSTISDPSGAGSAGVDTPARTAINSIIDLLQALGLMA